MKRLSARPRRRKEDDERILPLVNIVFLLLIFFMVVGRISAADPFEVKPPHSASDGPPETEPLLVLVGAGGRLALEGEVLEEDALLAQIRGRGVCEVRMKADGQAPALAVVALMERLRAAGVSDVVLLTVPTALAGR